MPLYEYECGSCGHADDEYQRMTDAHLTKCPRCGGSEYRRQVSRTSGAMVKEYHKPIEMHSIAPATPEELVAFQRRNPTVDVTPDGVPLARTRQEKLAILKNEGFQEQN